VVRKYFIDLFIPYILASVSVGVLLHVFDFFYDSFLLSSFLVERPWAYTLSFCVEI